MDIKKPLQACGKLLRFKGPMFTGDRDKLKAGLIDIRKVLSDNSAKSVDDASSKKKQRKGRIH